MAWDTEVVMNLKRRCVKAVVWVLSAILSMLIFWIVGTLFQEAYIASVPEDLSEYLVTGDVIFTEGHSLKSDIVRFGSGHENEISHVGFVQKREDGLYVTHMSIDDDKIVSELIDTFMLRNEVQGYVIMRMIPEPCSCRINMVLDSLIMEEIPFDNRYDIMEPSEWYCTELVCRVLDMAGCSLVDDMNDDGILYPSDLMKHEGLKLIYKYFKY